MSTEPTLKAGDLGDAPIIPIGLILAGLYLAWFGVHYWRRDLAWPSDPVKSVLQGHGLPKQGNIETSAVILTSIEEQTPSGGGSGGVVSVGGYVNPLQKIRNLVPERIDMGVDFSGTGLILAPGSGTITAITVPGWPNSTFICLRLDEGAYKGKYPYFAEDIHPSVHVGQHVNAGDVLGTMFAGGSGIECGWAAPPGLGNTMAAVNLQFNGSNTTAYGASFNRWLVSLGAPSGKVNNPPTGTVEAGYP